MIAAAFARTLNDGLSELGVDASGAEPWAYGVLGFGLSTGEWWLRRRTMSKAAVSRHLSSFVWNAFEGIARENGVRIDAAGTAQPDHREGRVMTHEPEEQYDGPATIADTEVEVLLRGHFEPIDGRFHWWGRIAANERLDAEQTSGATVTLVTPHGKADGRLSDVDPWGRLRISGTGRPPF